MINTERFQLHELKPDDVTDRYVSWLNDDHINRFLEIRHHHQTIETCRVFVQQVLMSENDYLFGVFDQAKNHIGNIRLGPIDTDYHRAFVGLVIGEQSWWGKGVAKEIIRAITGFGFSTLNLNKLEAGCYEQNLGSKKAFEYNGYQVEGFLRNHFIDRGQYTGSWYLGQTKDDWQKLQKNG